VRRPNVWAVVAASLLFVAGLACSAPPRAARIVALLGVGLVVVDLLVALTMGSYSEGLIVLPALPLGGLLAVAAREAVEPT
jgi:hypothetical protein